MADYSAFSSMARNLIGKFGAVSVVIRTEVGPYDPVLDSRPGTEIREETIAIMTSPTEREVNSGVFSSGTSVLLMAASGLSFSPSVNDRVEFSDTLWRVSSVSPVSPDGSAIIYKVGVVKAVEG